MSATCSSCGAEIVWTETLTGKAVPLDPPADAEKGNVLAIRMALTDEGDAPLDTDLAIILTGKQLEGARERQIKLYRTHFATCPSAAEHRR